jgi:molecular chaperone DnaK
MYKQANPAAGAPGTGPQPGGETGSSGTEQKKDEGVIDAEYVDVDDKK